jgi:TonB family protein
MHTFRPGLVGIILALALVASAQQAVTDYQVKAAYLYNFAESVQWPGGKLRPGGNIIVGVFGGDEDFLNVLRDILANKVINGHPLEIRQVQSPAEMKVCHLIFFRSSWGPTSHTVLAELSKDGILLVGQDRNFLNEGGMINLILTDGKISYEVNAAALGGAGLRYTNLIKSGSDSAPPQIRPESSRSMAFRVEPEYPRLASSLNLAGTVQLQAVVRADGTVKRVRVIGGHPVLAEAAAAALLQCRYEPGPRETTESVKISFGQ